MFMHIHVRHVFIQNMLFLSFPFHDLRHTRCLLCKVGWLRRWSRKICRTSAPENDAGQVS
jgi:nitrate reductase gamma subunit